jgi:hypothetical protein
VDLADDVSTEGKEADMAHDVVRNNHMRGNAHLSSYEQALSIRILHKLTIIVTISRSRVIPVPFEG